MLAGAVACAPLRLWTRITPRTRARNSRQQEVEGKSKNPAEGGRGRRRPLGDTARPRRQGQDAEQHPSKTAGTPAATSAPASFATVYSALNPSCGSCHISGAANAPVFFAMMQRAPTNDRDMNFARRSQPARRGRAPAGADGGTKTRRSRPGSRTETSRAHYGLGTGVELGPRAMRPAMLGWDAARCLEGGDLPGDDRGGALPRRTTASSGGMGVVLRRRNTSAPAARGAEKIMRGHCDAARGRALPARARRRPSSEQHVVRVTDADVAPELGAPRLSSSWSSWTEDLSDRLAKVGRMGAQGRSNPRASRARSRSRARRRRRASRPQAAKHLPPSARERRVRRPRYRRLRHLADPAPNPTVANLTGLAYAEDIFGTPWWMSPEQAMSIHHAVGPATNVWAVGLLAFQMLHGNSTGETARRRS